MSRRLRADLEIHKSAFGGDGIARLDGKVCFVEGALPGETVRAEITEDKGDYLKARVVEVLRPSAERVEPPCPYLEQCGGCQYQHVSYAEELRLKTEQLREIFERALRTAPEMIEPILPSPEPYGMRSSVTLHRTQADPRRPQRFSYIGRDNRSRVVVDACRLACPELQPVFRRTARLDKGVERVLFRAAPSGEISSDTEKTFLRMPLGREWLLAPSDGFFQNNLPVTARLADTIRQSVEAAGPEIFYDLYAGVGTFTFLCAARVPRVVCLEENASAVRALGMNAEERRRTGLRIHAGRVERLFAQALEPETLPQALVFLDPPRQGMEAGLASFLASHAPGRGVIYLSCDPNTLVRDLKILLSGPLRIRRVLPVDMFPRTKHIETAVWLDPRG